MLMSGLMSGTVTRPGTVQPGGRVARPRLVASPLENLHRADSHIEGRFNISTAGESRIWFSLQSNGSNTLKYLPCVPDLHFLPGQLYLFPLVPGGCL